MAFAYAARVFRFRIVAAKNSMKRQAAASPARPIAAGRFSKPARARSRRGMATSSETHGRACRETSTAKAEFLGVKEVSGVNLIVS